MIGDTGIPLDRPVDPVAMNERVLYRGVDVDLIPAAPGQNVSNDVLTVGGVVDKDATGLDTVPQQ